MLLARVAVASAWQGKGLGAGLLKAAMLRTLQAADIAGIREPELCMSASTLSRRPAAHTIFSAC